MVLAAMGRGLLDRTWGEQHPDKVLVDFLMENPIGVGARKIGPYMVTWAPWMLTVLFDPPGRHDLGWRIEMVPGIYQRHWMIAHNAEPTIRWSATLDWTSRRVLRRFLHRERLRQVSSTAEHGTVAALVQPPRIGMWARLTAWLGV